MIFLSLMIFAFVAAIILCLLSYIITNVHIEMIYKTLSALTFIATLDPFLILEKLSLKLIN